VFPIVASLYPNCAIFMSFFKSLAGWPLQMRGHHLLHSTLRRSMFFSFTSCVMEYLAFSLLCEIIDLMGSLHSRSLTLFYV
jgi:hypothetical protein